MENSINSKISIIIISLLIINIIIGILHLIPTKNEITTTSNNIKTSEQIVSENLAEQKALSEYIKMTGKANIQILDETISTTNYGSKSIIGTAINNNKTATMKDARIEYSFYKGDILISTSSSYFSEIKPNQKIALDIYAPKDFERYELSSISAYQQ